MYLNKSFSRGVASKGRGWRCGAASGSISPPSGHPTTHKSQYNRDYLNRNRNALPIKGYIENILSSRSRLSNFSLILSLFLAHPVQPYLRLRSFVVRNKSFLARLCYVIQGKREINYVQIFNSFVTHFYVQVEIAQPLIQQQG